MADEIKDLLIEEIFEDVNLNCRGAIIPLDVVDLARSIERNGLLQPITVQPFTSKDNPKIKYRIIVGHRRFTAFQVLKRNTIPAIVKVGLSEVQARILNFQENLERKNLNIMQEALTISKFKDAGYTMKEVGNLLNVSMGWVQIRYNLLSLEPKIQEAAAAGFLTQNHIKDLYSMPNSEARFEAVKRIKESKLKGEKKSIEIKKKKYNPLVRRARDRAAIYDMTGFILDTLGESLATKALGWAAGELSDLELYRDMKIEAEKLGKLFIVPSERTIRTG